MRGKVVIVTGGASGIGAKIASTFREQGAKVCVFDTKDNEFYVGDLKKPVDMDAFIDKVISQHKKVDYLINNACYNNGGIHTCDYDAFLEVFRVGVGAAYYLTQKLLPYFNEGAAIVNISSTRSKMSQANTESYSAAKGGIDALTHALAVSLSGKVRVNAISPGWIDTTGEKWSEADEKQHLTKRIGKPEDIAALTLFLCSEKASFITGENIAVDGGMSHQMIYHGDHGWHYRP